MVNTEKYDFSIHDLEIEMNAQPQSLDALFFAMRLFCTLWHIYTGLSEELYAEGYRDILNLDYSAPCIAKMQERCSGLVNMRWICMDATQLALNGELFDVAIDKVCLIADALGRRQAGLGWI